MSVPSKDAYCQALEAIRKEIADSTAAAVREVMRRRVLMYWSVGKTIARYIASSRRAQAEVIKDFGRDLHQPIGRLQTCLRFYRVYLKLPKKDLLSFSQYRALLLVPDKERPALEARVRQENLSADDIACWLRDFRASRKDAGLEDFCASVSKANVLPLERGMLYHYKVMSSNHPLDDDEVLIDCGFKVERKLTKAPSQKLTGGSLARSVYENGAYSVRACSAKPERLYTYQARITRVVDGDTMDAHIDCGFDVWVQRRLRLRGIDTAEVDTFKGVEAKRFVETILPKGKTVVVKTYEDEKFGRTLSDVFYLPDENAGADADEVSIASEGIFLNQELLDKGLAEVYEG